ncbi:WhiB family transcriptional regulator [Streptomyces sp. NPDC097617]|uniref:WhiB family transcriptional regulator n=1 Tax=Streptomyces sp. NPDC097617 TaxID=3366091 RepID=UPI00382E50B1
MSKVARLPGRAEHLWQWQEDAACRALGTDRFFHPAGERGEERSVREQEAKEVCGQCPVRAQCLSHALRVQEPYGVWGGLTEDERRALGARTRARRAG